MTFPQEHELMCAACGWVAEGEPEECENCQHKPLLKSWIRVRFNRWYSQWEVLEADE